MIPLLTEDEISDAYMAQLILFTEDELRSFNPLGYARMIDGNVNALSDSSGIKNIRGVARQAIVKINTSGCIAYFSDAEDHYNILITAHESGKIVYQLQQSDLEKGGYFEDHEKRINKASELVKRTFDLGIPITDVEKYDVEFGPIE